MKIDLQTVTRLNEFDWLFTSFFVFMLVAIPFAAVLRVDDDETLGRMRYFLRMLALTLVGYGITALVTIDPFHIAGRAYFLVNFDFLVTDFGLFTLWKVCAVISIYLQTRWTVCRIRDIGRFSRWWALLMLVPTISFVAVMVFALIPPRDPVPGDLESDDQSAGRPLPLLRAS